MESRKHGAKPFELISGARVQEMWDVLKSIDNEVKKLKNDKCMQMKRCMADIDTTSIRLSAVRNNNLIWREILVRVQS